MNQPKNSILRCEAGNKSFAMFGHSPLQIACDPGVHVSRPARQNVDPIGSVHVAYVNSRSLTPVRGPRDRVRDDIPKPRPDIQLQLTVIPPALSEVEGNPAACFWRLPAMAGTAVRNPLFAFLSVPFYLVSTIFKLSIPVPSSPSRSPRPDIRLQLAVIPNPAACFWRTAVRNLLFAFLSVLPGIHDLQALHPRS